MIDISKYRALRQAVNRLKAHSVEEERTIDQLSTMLDNMIEMLPRLDAEVAVLLRRAADHASDTLASSMTLSELRRASVRNRVSSFHRQIMAKLLAPITIADDVKVESAPQRPKDEREDA